MSVYVKRHCVSFPCVIYFCLFSPLKDRYAFSICLQLLGASTSEPHQWLCPWTLLGICRPQTPFCPLSKFLATPLCCIIQMYNANMLTQQ